MALIHANQVGAFDVSKVSGIVRRVTQDITATNGQTVFNMTVLDSAKRVIKRTYLEVNGVAYEERTADNPNGMFTRPTPYQFVWEFTAAKGGFDIEDSMTVSLVVVYVADYGNVDTMVKNVAMTDTIRSTKVAIGNYATDPANYFEQYDLSSIDFKEFLGLNVNGILYCHSKSASFNKDTSILSIAELKLEAADSVYFLVNVLTE